MNEVTYSIEIADMQAFQRHHRRISPVVRRARIFLLIFFAALSLNAAIQHDAESPAFRVIYFFVMLGIMILATSALTFAANWFAQFRAYRDGERHGILGAHTVTLTPDAVHERTAVNESKAAWRGIFRIDATPSHIFIFIQPNAAHVIPRRAFPAPEDAEAFLSTARSHYETARQNP